MSNNHLLDCTNHNIDSEKIKITVKNKLSSFIVYIYLESKNNESKLYPKLFQHLRLPVTIFFSFDTFHSWYLNMALAKIP